MTKIIVNGIEREAKSPDDTPLLWVLRDEFKLKGTKFSCGKGLCGACTIHLNGAPIRSCSLPLAASEGARITTIEGLDGSIGAALKDAWLAHNVPQCGYCQVGQLMQAAGLLNTNPSPNDHDIDLFMRGNICRCGTYQRIRQAIKYTATQLTVPTQGSKP